MSKKIMVFDSNKFSSKHYTGLLGDADIQIEDAEQKNNG